MRGVLSSIIAAACLATPAMAYAQDAEPPVLEQASESGVSDPWEGFNRDLFAVHESVDQAVIEPVARGYRAITPSPLQQGVRNFLRNLRGPVIFVNDVLQGEVERAGVTAARFALNTTIGIGGVFDPAESAGLERHDEDFGQTLAVWGVDPGPYVFVPLMGPSNVRDAFGRVVDTALDPLSWTGGDDAATFRGVRTGLAALSTREQLLDPVDDVRANSVDPYASFRSSYSLLRESAIQNGRSDVQDLPEFDDMQDMQNIEPAPEAETPSSADTAGEVS